MPKVLNPSGVVSIVSQKRMIEMVRDDGAQLLNEPDMLPGDPVDSRSARQPNVRRLSPPTKAEQQVIAAQKEALRDIQIANKEARQDEANEAPITIAEADTPEDAMKEATEEVKRRGRPAKK